MFYTFVSYHTQLLVDVNDVMLLIYNLLSFFSRNWYISCVEFNKIV